VEILAHHFPPRGDPHGPRRYDDPDSPEHSPAGSENERPGHKSPGYNSDTERFIDNLDISERDKELLRCYCQIKDEVESYKSFQSQRAFGDQECSEKLDNIRELIQSADPVIRERAEFELQQIVEDMKYVYQQELLDKFREDYYKITPKSENSENENQNNAKSDTSSINVKPAVVRSNPASVPSNASSVSHSDDLNLLDMPELEEGSEDLTWDPDPGLEPQAPDVNIALPNVNINIRQPRVRFKDTSTSRPLLPMASRRTPSRSRHQNVEDWLVGQSPQHGDDPPPVTTRSGRISKPVSRLDPTAEAKAERELREAIRRSLPPTHKGLKRLSSTGKSVKPKASNVPLVLSKRSAPVESEKPKSSVKTKTVAVSTPLKSKTSSVRHRSVSASKHSFKLSGANKKPDSDSE
jgi:hypothetical protein